MSQQSSIILQKRHSLERGTAVPYLETFGVVLLLVTMEERQNFPIQFLPLIPE